VWLWLTVVAPCQGLSTSGEGPLPLLWRVALPSGVEIRADLLASLLSLLSSVRVFTSYCPSAYVPH
jgi:hypothetical protein